MAAEVGNAVVSAVASKVAESSFDAIKREISYVFKYQSYVDNLKNQFEQLGYRRERVKKNVDSARRQVDEIHQDVQDWLIRVDRFTREVARPINEDENEAKKLCFKGLCPNVFRRYSLSKKAVKATKAATDLLAKGNFSSVSYSPLPETMEFKNAVKDHQEFNSRMKVFQDVMEALEDPKVNMIGVYGPGGVGKTTLANQVAKKVKEDKLIFDEVVTVELTQNPNLNKIQVKFAYDLGLKFLPHESEFDRVDKLRRRLKEKRVLVILDNIWKKLDLEAIGIPFGDEEKEGKGRRCTVLLTSRDRRVLRNDMNSQKDFHIEVLCHEEAMILFWKTMDGIIDGHSAETASFQLLADEIVRKCEGLPVAITTIACALKHQPIVVWKDGLDGLKNFDTRRIHGMEANVYSIIKLSYDYLDDEEAKSLFRLCALHGDGSQIPINDLMMYVMGLGWFMTFNSLEQLRTRVYALIHHLKSSSLLLDGDNEHVQVHDIIHDVGVSIAKEEHMFNIQNVGDLKEELEKVIAKDPIAISLTCREFQELPQRLECPKLNLFLFLSNHGCYLEIENLFSEGMKELRVLNLARIDFLSSPPSLISLACLTNLRTLSLFDCYSLVDVAVVGELKKLEILSFRGSDIEKLPSEIGQLTRLKKLDLSYCSELVVIAPNVILKLSRLEELCMVNSFTLWEKEEGGSNASLVELNRLKELTTLEINIPDVKIVPQDLVSVNLERFKIFIGDEWEWITKDNKGETSRTLKFNGLDKNIYLGKGMKMLLKKTEDLWIDDLNGFENVVHQLDDGEGLQQLKYLSLQNSPEILYIVNSMGRVQCNAFALLESLFLNNLINLEKICYGQLMEDQYSFCKLRIIKVKECHKLRYLFSCSMVKNLLQLQEIEVTNCEGLNLIVGEERENLIVRENEDINFTQLRSLSLTGLPQLTYLRFNEEISHRLLATPSSASNEIIAEDDPQDLITVLFNNKVTFPTLEMLKLSSLNIKKIWFGQFSTCQNLTKLEVKGCSHLKFLFSYSMVHSLVQLQNLVIEECESMEWVINTNGLRRDKEQMIRVMVFPKLKSLTLSDLPRLTRFISMSSFDTDMQSLFDEKVAFPSLEELEISSVNELRKIWHHQLDLDSFSKLKQLQVTRCHKLMNIFSSNIILERRFQRSEKVRVFEEETISDRMVDEEFSIASTSTNSTRRLQLFPQLTSMQLESLPDLKSIYQGVHVFEWPMLKYLVIKGCEKVEILFGSSELFCRETEIQQPMFLIDHHKVTFPNLELLKIGSMTELRKIWQHQLDSDSFSKLKQLNVIYCDKLMNIFSSNIILGRRFQRLEVVSVHSCKLIKEIIEEETNSDRMGDEEFPIASTSTNATRRLHVFPQLTKMKLLYLPNLISFYQGVHVFEWTMIKYLMVNSCEKIEILFGSSELLSRETEIQPPPPVFLIDHHKVTFPNLKTLIVQYCDGLRSLTTLSTVRSLINLERIEIFSCKMIKEIVQQVGEVKEDPIIFSQLIHLKIDGLPRLEHFLGGNITLEFPDLEQVVVRGCLNMRIFSRGILRTAKLKKLQMTNRLQQVIAERWEGSLNSTIQKMFEEMAEVCNLDSLILSHVSRVKEIWHDQTLPVRLFGNLRNLVVDDCKLMSRAIPANLLWLLKNLINLTVKNCDSVEEVFHMEEINANEHSVKLFPNLGWLYLIDLPKLKRFCNFSRSIIELPSLEFLTIENCPNMETFISNSTDDQPLFNKKVAFHKLEELNLSKLPKLLHLCKENSRPIDIFHSLLSLEISECSKLEQVVPSWVSFNNLTTMEVSKCDGLINLVGLPTAKSLVQLERIKVTDCKMIEEIIHVIEEVKKDCVVLIQLKSLELSCLPSLTSFFLGNYTLEFPSLEQVIVKECPKMEIFSRGVLSTPKLERLQLTEIEDEEIVKEDEWLWEGSLNATIQKLFEKTNVQSTKDED